VAHASVLGKITATAGAPIGEAVPTLAICFLLDNLGEQGVFLDDLGMVTDG